MSTLMYLHTQIHTHTYVECMRVCVHMTMHLVIAARKRNEKKYRIHIFHKYRLLLQITI